MAEFFLKIINMSISASWLVLAVLVLRLVLKKAPKWVGVLLWGIVAVRLLCPFSIESALSLIPSAETVSPEIMTDWTPEIYTGVPAINSVLNPVISETFAPNPAVSANPLQLLIPVASLIWVTGVAAMLVYLAISYWQLRRKVATAILVRERIYQTEYVKSPFVLGILKPRIYLPFHIELETLPHVIAHEQAHIHRKDHWWKPLGFLLLAIHWFNPLMWVAYILLCRDIELACDESVIGELNSREKAAYTQALLDCSINRRIISACPLAFGEVGVKVRVKTVMHYKKPAFWIVVLSILVCGAVAVCFLTDPKNNYPEDPNSFAAAESTYAYYLDGTLKESTVRNGGEFTRTKYRKDGTISLIHREEEDCTVDEVYDEAGNRKKYVAEYVSGKRNECVYDSEGRTISWVSITENGLQRTVKFSYYENGNVKTRIYTDEAHGMKDERYFNEDGSPASEYIQYSEMKLEPEVVVEELSKESIYDADGSKTTKTTYRDGKIWETKTDAAGSRVWEKTTQPDGSTEEIFYNKDGSNRYLVNGEEV